MCGASWRKPAHQITDRAKRYRANTPECCPPLPRKCALCEIIYAVETEVEKRQPSDAPRMALILGHTIASLIERFQTEHQKREQRERAIDDAVWNQRCSSSYTLIERIEDCFSKDSCAVLDKTAKREFEESGKCLALERYTAAGFHSLRGVECVIRQYLEKLTGAQLPKDRKRDWGFYIQTLKDNGADANLLAVPDAMHCFLTVAG